MESQDGRHDGAEGGSSEVKPGQMDLIAAMLICMRQEMAADREAQAQRAREQTQRADDQVRHLEHVLQSSVASLKAETQQYTDQAILLVLLLLLQPLAHRQQGGKEYRSRAIRTTRPRSSCQIY